MNANLLAILFPQGKLEYSKFREFRDLGEQSSPSHLNFHESGKRKFKVKTIYDAEPAKFNAKLAEALKQIEEFQMPEWAVFVKTSASRVRPPYDTANYWYIRAASILRQVYIKGVVGVNRLKTKYGGRKKRGSRPEEFRKASGKIIRVMLQQAEKAGLLRKSEGKRKGRELTKKGLEFMNKIASEVN